MLFNPINILARIFVRSVVRLLNLPNNIPLIFRTLVGVSSGLINTVGFIPVIRVLLQFRRSLMYTLNIPAGANRTRNANNLFERFAADAAISATNTFIVNTIIEAIKPLWTNELTPFLKTIFNLISFIVIPLLSINSFRILYYPFKWAFKVTLGSIIGSLGILWSETLSSYSILKSFAQTIIGLVNQFISPLEVEIDVDEDTSHTRPNGIGWFTEEENVPVHKVSVHSHITEKTDVYSVMSIIGFVIVGIAGVVTLLVITDNYVAGGHEVISEIPYVSTVVDTITSTINSIYSYFFSNHFGRGGDGSNINNHLPESITRTSSGSSDSDITITDLRTDRSIPLTPPLSRPETPSVQFSNQVPEAF
jgi:hypothetical protein